MQIKDLTLLTVSFNNNVLTGMMIKSFIKQFGEIPEIIIVDNGNKIPVDDGLKNLFTVLDNFQNKLIPNKLQPSRNHCATIDYALKHCIKTKYVLLVDNDILFKPKLKSFIKDFDETKYDAAGEIGYDVIPPNRLFPYCCLINVEKMKKENLSYYDENRIISFGMPGHFSKKDDYYDTGSSFLEDIKSWKILEIKLSDICIHMKGASLRNKDYKSWLTDNKELFS